MYLVRSVLDLATWDWICAYSSDRRYLKEQLNVVLTAAETNRQQDIALLFLDLDRFKIINDSLGHHVGDLFLIEVAQRLTRCMRNDDVVVRLGGDEFCILMFDVQC